MTEQIDYDPNTVLEALNNKADRDLNNVTDGTYQVLTTKNITNCITKIPQDIKLEFNDGTLTLKAGSKVYVPNGVGKYDVVTISSDISGTRSANIAEFWFYNKNSKEILPWNNLYSGSTAPSGNQYMVWYDTTNNKVKYTTNSGSTWEEGFSLPLCIATSSTTQIISIDQVFNGFGYIGSTIFALPGVEGLIPNGRNSDDSLNNTKFTTTKVLTRTLTATDDYEYALTSGGRFYQSRGFGITQDNYLYDIASGEKVNGFKCFSANLVSGRIISFNPNTTFQAIDRNEIDNIIDTRINYRFQVVSELPPVQDPNTFYFIPEE